MPLLHGSVAVAVLQALPPVDITEPLGWLSLVLAILVANVVVALMISGAIIGTAGYPGSQLWRQQLVPIAVVSPVVVSVGIIALLLASLSSWAWLLVVPVLHRRRTAVPAVREGLPRRQQRRARLRLRPPRGAGLPGRGRHRADRRRRSGSCSTPSGWRSGCRPYLDEEPRLVVSAENGAVWYDGPGDPDDVFRRRAVASDEGPLLVSLARADDEEAAAPRPPRGLRPAGCAGDDRGRRAGLPRGLRPPQRHRLLRRQRPGRPGLDAHPRQRGHPAPAAAHPDPLRRRPRPADRAAQPPAPGRRDRPAPRRRTRSAPAPG